MELIPILSLIILVATISTFVLAVGAYILFKVREKQGRAAKAAAPPASIPAELIAPAPMMTGTGSQSKTFEDSAVTSRLTGPDMTRRPTFFTATKDTDPSRPQMKPTFTNLSPTQMTGTRFTKPETAPTTTRPTMAPTTTQTERYDSKKKFMRYTSEGYVDPSAEKTKEKKKKEETLRWR